MKITNTLLLLCIVAGVISTSAYAQSNTERIVSIYDNVNSMTDVIDGIVDSIEEIMDSMTEQFTGIQNQLSSIDSKINSTQADITSINANIDSAKNSIDSLTDIAIGIQGSVTGLENVRVQVAEVSSSISGFSSVVDTIQATVEVNRLALTNIDGKINSMSANIDTIRNSLSQSNDDDLVSSVDFLSNSVNRFNVDITTRLDAIESRLDALETTQSTPPAVSISPTPNVGLQRHSVTETITSYTYKSAGTKSGNVYTLDMDFSCDGPVSLDRVRTSSIGSAILPSSNPTISTPINYLEVDGRDLYHSRFQVSTNAYTTLTKSVVFNLDSLPVGSTLKFSSQQHESGTSISSSTSNNHTFRYDIVIEYLGSSSTTCTLDTGSTVSAGVLSKADSLIISANVDTSGSIINTFSNTIDCDDDPIEITSIEAQVLESWPSELSSFSEFKLTFLDGNNDSTADVNIGFDSSGNLNTTTYPIAVSGADLLISGRLPNVGSMLIVMNYNTISDGACTNVTQ